MSWDDTKLAKSNSLNEVLQATIGMLKQLRADGLSIHHVAGAITADGDNNINKNLTELLEWRNKLAAKLSTKAFVFTSPVIFSEGLYGRLKTFDKEPLLREAEFQDFWDKLLESGLIDVIHFTPGWERSLGAQREHDVATRLGIKINYFVEAKKHD